MDKVYFLDLLKKFREGTTTPAEEQFIQAYYAAFESQPDVVSLLTPAEKQRLKNNLHAGILEQIAAQEDHFPAAITPVRLWLKIAAAIMILAGAATAGFLLLRTPPAVKTVVQSRKVQPASENNFIQLPDGSTVIVSPGSKLEYPASFDGQPKREVYLEGKALFQVDHQSVQPFVVHTGNVQTTVLGTSFEIRAMPGMKDITVTVIKGKVQVAHDAKTLGILSANEQIIYNTSNKEHHQLQLDAKAQVAWQAEDLFFDDVTMQYAARLLEERFQVTVSITDEKLQSSRFSTTFAKEESLEQVLNSICTFNNAAYRIDKAQKTVIIYSR